MKHVFLTAVALFTLASCQQQKMGWVNSQTVINEIQEKKVIEEKFTTINEAFIKNRDSLNTIFAAQYRALDENTNKLSQKKLEEAGQVFNKNYQAYQQQLQMKQQQIQKEYQTEIDTLIVKVKGFVHNYGETNGYSYILGTNDAVPSVLYGEEKTDLSQVILEAIDAEYNK